jgi:predicted nucleotidyltransferase
MNLNWLNENVIYVTLAGSQAYGLANEFSDVDVKGICVPPPEVEYNLFHRFEQAENPLFLEERLAHLKNPKNPKFESTLYSLRKFFLLAAEVNPNIIELLYTDPKHHFICGPLMQRLLEKRELFLSNKARYTFSGYAVAQAKKIERHRKWIVLGEVPKPNRESFGLPKSLWYVQSEYTWSL